MAQQHEAAVERITVAGSAAAVAVVLSLVAIPVDAVLVSGIAGAVGAILVFGTSSIPAKHPEAAPPASDPALFQAACTLGNAATTLACGLVEARRRCELRRARFTPWGVAGAMILTATQRCAWPAIRILGASVGPGLWCGVGMMTSFFWGVVAFGETPREPEASVGIAALAVGVAGVAAAQVAAARGTDGGGEKDDDDDGVELVAKKDDAAAAEAPGGGVATPLGRGFFLAVATGVLDGSLMAPFRAYASTARGDPTKTSYFLSFAAGLPLVCVPSLVLARRRGATLSPGGARAGVAAGALWAVGNFAGVHATAGLGQAVGFPLTQVCVLVSAGLGMTFFGELAAPRPRAIFLAAAATVLAGAALLGSGTRAGGDATTDFCARPAAS